LDLRGITAVLHGDQARLRAGRVPAPLGPPPRHGGPAGHGSGGDDVRVHRDVPPVDPGPADLAALVLSRSTGIPPRLTVAAAMYPQAGGLYHFLKEAYGPVWGFLYGWASFLVIMSGGIAALAVGFGEYLGSFVPFLSTSHVLVSAPIGPWRWTLSGGQLAG